jgi:hypothetical protein
MTHASVPQCNFPFRGFEATVKGKRDLFTGIARISAVGPDYRGPESWVVLNVKAQGVKHGFGLPESHEPALGMWLKRNPAMSKDINQMLKMAVRGGRS